MTLNFHHRRAVVMIHTHTESQVQMSAGLQGRVETNGRTDTTDRIIFPVNATGKMHTMK